MASTWLMNTKNCRLSPMLDFLALFEDLPFNLAAFP
jgi:hypothetical protein